ncbi:MAG: hypothetical protein IPK04_20235 [Bdellovibrionales bacterium]|nr:hypothetical protein [Bdellovibrionales bacterium]
MTSLKISLFLALALALGPATLEAQSKSRLKSPQSKANPIATKPAGRKPATAVAAPPAPTKATAQTPAQTSAPATSAPRGLSAGGGEAKALEVRGQARSLQMMMLLKGKGDDIHFVKPRKDFRPEVNTTTY